ncbi:hypothetical protein F5X68DRAFT_14590 [Plectosphaerella plurivora]|uniref:Association with the SNF1 complex (ASC) domain-containing protein n=1 Tax=Plectosphaerella plurivora TaxID=936078 RepID=A0A9P9AAA7_9PEZI|nr:hypothetical protein F5X68DRAFT_14590 [Plectosphaerella plurivora]
MGNNPSSQSKPGTPSSSAPGSGHESPRHPKRDSKHILPHRPTERVAAPPEASLHQALGSTISKGSGPRPLQAIPISAGLASASPASSSNNNTPPPQHIHQGHGHGHSHSQSQSSSSRPIPRDEPSKPVDVPAPHTEPSSLRSLASAHAAAPSAAVDQAIVSQNSISDMSYITRPPRLPLPIEEEVHTPGSPIIAPADADPGSDAAVPVAAGDIEGLDSSSEPITRKSSALSNATVDEEDGDELIVDKTRPVVPTRLEWLRGGDKIYVTGTIFQWNRKQRLHPVEGRPGAFAGTVYILPGTHHVRFLVDGIMQTSPDLPTTVDFGNNLVNYIEVSADDLPSARRSATEASGVTPEQAATKLATQADEAARSQPRGKAVPSTSQYFHSVPQYLIDFDQPEESTVYQYAIQAIDKLPQPPSLPGFLAKPILNAGVLMKDDNSVLNMPNHTVLNHLATSSIKNNILAVSATTRYKSKVRTPLERIFRPAH